MSSIAVELRKQLETLKLEQKSLLSDLNDIIQIIKRPKTDVHGCPIDTVQSLITELKRIKEQDANKLIQLTEQTHLTAAKMSSAIKKRDLERIRLLSVLDLLHRLEEIEEKLDELEKDSVNQNVNDDENLLVNYCSRYFQITVMIRDNIIEDVWESRQLGQQIIKKSSFSSTNNVVSLRKRIEHIKKAFLGKLRSIMSTISFQCQQQFGKKQEKQEKQDDGSPLISSDLDKLMGKAFYLLLQGFYPLNELDIGLNEVASIIQTLARSTLQALLDFPSSLDFHYAVQIGKIYEYIDGFLRWEHQTLHDNIISGGISTNMANQETNRLHLLIDAKLATILVEEAETAMVKTIRAFAVERRLRHTIENLSLESGSDQRVSKKVSPLVSPGNGTAVMANNNKVNVRELDLIVAEMALITQSALALPKLIEVDYHNDGNGNDNDNDNALVSIPKLEILLALLGEFVNDYAILEVAYLQNSIKKAINVNQILYHDNTGNGGVRISSCVEDIFFLVEKVSKRVLAVGEVTALLMVWKGILDTLEHELIKVVIQQKYIKSKGSSSELLNATAVSINDALMSTKSLENLEMAIKQTVLGKILSDEIESEEMPNNEIVCIQRMLSLNDSKLDGVWRRKLKNCLVGLDRLNALLEEVLSNSIRSYYYHNATIGLKIKISSFIQLLGREISTNVAVTGTNTPLIKVVPFVENALIPAWRQTFPEEIVIRMILHFTQDLATSFEHILPSLPAASVTLPWIECLHDDFRHLLSYLQEVTDLRAGSFLERVRLMISFWDHGRKEDAYEFMARKSRGEIGNGNIDFIQDEITLTPMEMQSLAACRGPTW